MGEGTGMATISEMRTSLMQKAADDDAFRAQLIADPKAAVEDALGVEIPGGFNLHVHEEDASTSHLVLPPTADLSEADMATAAGAGLWDTAREDLEGVGRNFRNRWSS